MDALLALEDGRIFNCHSFTGPGEVGGEVVFNTSMTGYQEILTDPSYCGQMVTMTYPLIGNYGINIEDVESNRIQAAAFIIRECQVFPSNYRSTGTLSDYLMKQNIMGIDEIDTRALTRHIRQAGAMRAIISTEDPDPISLVDKAKHIPSMVGQDLVSGITTPIPYRWVDGLPKLIRQKAETLEDRVWLRKGEKYSVVALDYGIKYNIIRLLEKFGCEVIVLPASTTTETIKAISPDGIFLSNGPGDPEPVSYAVKTIRELLSYRPIFGICLGIELLGLAFGGDTFKLKFGHRGANHPVKNLITGRIEITCQNHGFAVDLDSIKDNDIEITHINLNDHTLEGLRHKQLPILAVQYHPEASPGPHDARYLFSEFVNMMKTR
jgi:carbamoyl-phosphate synthase small subunit